jgi:hypothetical protein
LQISSQPQQLQQPRLQLHLQQQLLQHALLQQQSAPSLLQAALPALLLPALLLPALLLPALQLLLAKLEPNLLPLLQQQQPLPQRAHHLDPSASATGRGSLALKPLPWAGFS